MHLVRWPGGEAPALERSVVTLGVFDGVHRGHRGVIQRTLDAARQRSCTSAIVTFDRHPAGVLSGRSGPSITSLAHRIRIFERFEVDVCVVVEFTAEVAQMGAAEFARAVFTELLRAELVVLGYDCRFGRDREADPECCRRLGRELGFEVLTVPPVEMDGAPVSSTDIRGAILAGDFGQAERLLGRPFSLCGTVVQGEGRGHRLGYPTANLDLHNEVVPPDGVYACWVFIDHKGVPGVTSIGRRETFHREPEAERVVEVHLIARREELYGRDMEVQFVGRLRGQVTFEGPDELKAQVAGDVENALRMLEAEGENA